MDADGENIGSSNIGLKDDPFESSIFSCKGGRDHRLIGVFMIVDCARAFPTLPLLE